MENLPMKYEETFFGKIKTFFKNLFRKNEVDTIKNVETVEKKEIVDIPKSNTFEKLQNEYKKSQNKEFIVEQTIKHPETIKNLSEEKLKKLNELYDEKIKENKKIIAKNDKKIMNLRNKLKQISA